MAEGGSKLSEEEIYEFLKSLNVPVRINDLKTPTREFIVRVFECFTRDLQIDTAIHMVRTWEATKHIEEPEIYDDAQLLILLAMSVNQITNPCGLDITIKDIVEPKPKRTKKILHYLLVFWSYYLQKCARFKAIEETFESEKKKAEHLLLENELLDEKYEENMNILKTVQPSKSELLSTVASKEEKCAKLHGQSETLLSDYQELKKKVANLHNQIGEADINIVTAKERLEELSQLIISSPDRINLEIQNLKDKIKAKDVKIKEKENEVKDAKQKLQMQEESLKDDEKAMSSLKNINEEIQHLRGTVKCIIINQQKLDSGEDKIRKLQFDLEQKKEWKFQQDQKSARVVLSTRKQRETLMEVQQMLQSEEARERKAVDFCKAAVNDMQNKIDNESESILEMNKKRKEAYVKTEEMKKQYISKMKEHRDNFQFDCDQIHQIIRKKFPS